MEIHRKNNLLPALEQEHVSNDDDVNLRQIHRCLETIETSSASEANPKIIGLLFRLWASRRTLKYRECKSTLSKTVNLLITQLTTVKSSHALTTRILQCLCDLCKKKWVKIEVLISWRFFWSKALGLTTRENKVESLSGENTMTTLASETTKFIHLARRFIPLSECDDIVAQAMAKLQDTRHLSCIEGLLLLVNCLPTDYPKYDEMMPQWTTLWASIDNNPHWDCCWLTIFTRARKHTRTFDWRSLSQFFAVKARELMQFPTGPKLQGKEFPHSFPSYYVTMLVNLADPRSTALNKLAKLMYFNAIQGGELVVAEPMTITPPKIGSDIPPIPGFNVGAQVSQGAMEIALFFQSVRHFLYASNTGPWSQQVAYFTATLVSEMSRHVGRALGARVFGGSVVEGGEEVMKGAGATVFEASPHVPTLDYLGGCLAVLLMEGLYSKNSMLMRLSAASMKNLVATQPHLGHILTPFLLAALDPAAVNQSHQAPVAMHTLSLCFKPLLFPEPTILRFLPDLLRLSLPGVDPNDSSKTASTLTLYSTILGWIPVRPNYSLPDPASCPRPYLELIADAAGEARPHAFHWSRSAEDPLVADALQLHLDVLGRAWAEWVPLFVDKAFAVLQSLEAKQKGVAASPITSALTETMGMLFQAIECPTIRLLLETKILSFFDKTTPTNAAKVAAKILDSMVANNPTSLGRVLTALLGSGVSTLGNVSAAKLAFRLRLAGGAVRSAGTAGIVDQLPILVPFWGPEFLEHSEKPVRKAVLKLIKDIFKGSTSFYPVEVSPILHAKGQADALIGSPNIIHQMKWHIPNEGTLPPVIALLRTKAVAAMDAVKAILTSAPHPHAESSSTSVAMDVEETKSFKKAEELIVINLSILNKLLRGAAEILGDADVPPVSDAGASSVGGDEVTADDAELLVGEPRQPFAVLGTSREGVLRALGRDDRVFLESLRFTVMEFLLFVSDFLESLPTKSSSPPVSGGDESTLTQANPLSGLQNSVEVQKAWMKVLNISLTRRLASLKGVDQVRKWMSMSKRMTRTVLVKTVMLYSKRRGDTLSAPPLPLIAPALNASMRTAEYWSAHDVNSNTLSNSPWMTYASRQQELSYAATKRILVDGAGGHQARVYEALVRKLAALCGHEYQGIRAKANAKFQEITKRFGWDRCITKIIRPMMHTLTTPGTPFASASGAISLIRIPAVMKRVSSDWALTQLFLSTVVNCSPMIAAIEEPDKRETIKQKVADAVTKYSTQFNHTPLPDKGSTAIAALADSCLSFLGFEGEGEGSGTVVAMSSTSSTTSGSAAAAGAGLRQEAYAAFVVLHLLCHNDVVHSPATWTWAVQTLSFADGQPQQHLAHAALIKLAFSAFSKGIDGANFQVLQKLLGPKAPSDVGDGVRGLALWGHLLHGFSSCHSKNESDGSGAQWAKGISELLRSAQFLACVFPRRITAIHTDSNCFSNRFSKENAGFFWCLFSLFLRSDAEGEGSPLLTQEFVNSLLVVSKDIPSTSEEDTKSNNALRAELFSGLLKVAIVNRTMPGAAELEKALVVYLNEHVEKVSTDYCGDWAEGVLFAMASSSGSSEAGISSTATFILDGFKSVLLPGDTSSSSSPAQAPGPSTGAAQGTAGAGEEGFARLDKRLMLARALLLSDIAASVHSRSDRSLVGDQIIHVVRHTEAEIISPYRSTRQDVASMISYLSNYINGSKTDFSGVCAKISSATVVDTSTVVSAGDSGAMAVSAGAGPGVGTAVGATAGPKHALEVACACVRFALSFLVPWRAEEQVTLLLSALLVGCGHPEAETAKLCHDTCVLVGGSIRRFSLAASSSSSTVGVVNGGGAIDAGGDAVAATLRCLVTHAAHSSLHVRETVMMCGAVLMTNNWQVLEAGERKSFRDVFAEGLWDAKPEVQVLAQAGMVAYLAMKPANELNTLALAHIKNSDILATREKKRRKAGGDTAKPERTYISTVLMTSCLVLAFPYDLPPFLPALVTSLVKHATVPAVQDVVTKTVQSFKRTHQDRWEDFKKSFTREQLEDLQGAGAAHYFS